MEKEYFVTLDHDAELDAETPLETWGTYPDDYEKTLAKAPERLGLTPEGNPVYKITLEQVIDTERGSYQVNTVCPVYSACPIDAFCRVNGGESYSIHGIHAL